MGLTLSTRPCHEAPIESRESPAAATVCELFAGSQLVCDSQICGDATESVHHHRISACPILAEEAIKSLTASLVPQAYHCHLRVISVSDVYLLDNLPALKSLVAAQSKGLPPENVITVLPGDFLGPSLLSSLDAGFSMVKALNQVPINMVCFGNHDGNDIAYPKLAHRVQEFEGIWLNSNIPGFQPKLPKHCIRQLVGSDGSPSARTVAFLGLCVGGGKHMAMYRDDAFGGAHQTIIPVNEAAPVESKACRDENPGIDEIIPLTHQDMPEDLELAGMDLFPVVIGGHDHDQMLEARGKRGCQVVKAGMDAASAAVIDLVWPSAEKSVRPTVTVAFHSVSEYAPDAALQEMCEKAMGPVRDLESATLFELQGRCLSSVDARLNDVSMARELASWVRGCLNCQAAIINSGTIRGNKMYHGGISYGDLKKECPFQSAMVVVHMPFSVLRDGIHASRRPWWDVDARQPKSCGSALQVDDGMVLKDHVLTSIKGVEINAEKETDDKLYSVCCDHYVLRKNCIFKEYCRRHPERVPPPESGRPLLPILVEFCCTSMWRRLIEGATRQLMGEDCVHKFKRVAGVERLSQFDDKNPDKVYFESTAHKVFDLLDDDGDGVVDRHDLQAKVRSILGDRLSSSIVVEQLLQMVDDNADGMLSYLEVRTAIRKLTPK